MNITELIAKKDLLIKKKNSSVNLAMVLYLQAQIDLLLDLILEEERNIRV